MKKQILLIFLCLFFSSKIFSQESWMRIYQSIQWQVKSYFKIHNSDNTYRIFLQHNSHDTISNSENGAIKKYIKNSNSWITPANEFLNVQCRWIIEPPYIQINCQPTTFFMTSAQDTNFILKYLVTPAAQCPDANTFITINGGLSSNYIGGFGCGGSLFYPNGGDINPDNDSICYYGYINHNNYNLLPTIFKSTNKGTDWNAISTIEDLRHTGPSNFWDNLSGGFIKINPFNTDYIFTVHRDYMMLSTDGGYNFSSINIPPLKELSFDYTDNIIFGVSQNKIYKSINNGVSWDSSDVPFSLNTLEVSPDNNNIIYAGTQTGLYRSLNQGASWDLYNNSFTPSKNVIGLSKEINTGDTIFVCTNDAVYKVFRDFLVGISNSNSITAGSYILEQNFPNPFNPNTIINYELSTKNYVTLKIFNSIGKEVATLVNQKQSPGRYSVDFNAANLPSGIYFYRIQTEGFIQTKGMMLLK
ncbi:MAG: T9SS type A sorting domain-containing protein [Bacteroidota bacterium]|nr:T9SS type A sorting domain-containing protein [Bacteroidota bacterium]